MVNIGDMKKVWRSPTGITVCRYCPRTLNDYMDIVNETLRHSSQEYHTEISFEDWGDIYLSKIGIIMMTPVIFITPDDYIYLCEYFINEQKNDTRYIDICGKDKLYLDSTFDVDPFKRYLDAQAVVKTVEPRGVFEFNKIITQLIGTKCLGGKHLDGKHLDGNYYYTFNLIDSKYLVHNSNSMNKKCMLVMLSKIFSYYNNLSYFEPYLKSEDEHLQYFFTNNFILSSFHADKLYYTNQVFYMNMNIIKSFLTFYKEMVGDISQDRKFRILDQFTRYVVLNESFISKYIENMCIIVEYGDKRFLVVETEEQAFRLKQEVNSPTLKDKPVLFTKNLEPLYKKSLLKSGCGGYDAISIDSILLKH